MISATVKTDTSNIIRRIRRLNTDLQKSGEYSVEHVGRYIRDNLKLHIPKDTGTSARSIIIERIKNTKTKHSLLVKFDYRMLPNKKFGDKKKGGEMVPGGPFYLPQWFMQSAKARREQRYYSGSINEYRNVVPEAKRIFATRIRDDIKNATKTN